MALRNKFIFTALVGWLLGWQVGFSQTFVSSPLPIIVIKTNGQVIKDEPKVPVSMGIIYKGSGIRNSLTDPFNHYNGKVAIEFRGSSSQMTSPKKPFGFETQDEKGENLNISLLGLPAENDWVLLAPYSDKTLVRDVFTYDVARQMYATWVPRTQFCELVLDDQYQGVYVLTEKIKRDKNRVNISEMKKTDNSGDALTGGYIVKLDKFTGGASAVFTSPFNSMASNRIVYQIEYPDIKDITPEQTNYISNYITSFEQMLASPTFTDSLNGYTKWIDVQSFVDYFLMTEFTKNVDGYRLSTFFYKQKDSKGGKIVMGPLWDYNITYGAGDFCDNWKPTGWQFEQYKICYSDIPFWWSRLLQDKNFAAAILARWLSLRKTVWNDEKLFSRLDSTVNSIGEARLRNFQKWNILNTKVWSNYYVGGNYSNEYEYMRMWLQNRIAWLDKQIPALAASVGVITAVELPIFSFAISPNPAKDFVNITYELPKSCKVRIEAFDLTGRSVATVLDEEKEAGKHQLAWQNQLPQGVYVLRCQAEGQALQSRKLVIQ